MAKWMIDAGNSSEGAIGFTLYGIEADTAKEALDQAQGNAAPALDWHDEYIGQDDRRYAINFYINVEALTLANVYEDDEPGEAPLSDLIDPADVAEMRAEMMVREASHAPCPSSSPDGYECDGVAGHELPHWIDLEPTDDLDSGRREWTGAEVKP